MSVHLTQILQLRQNSQWISWFDMQYLYVQQKFGLTTKFLLEIWGLYDQIDMDIKLWETGATIASVQQVKSVTVYVVSIQFGHSLPIVPLIELIRWYYNYILFCVLYMPLSMFNLFNLQHKYVYPCSNQIPCCRTCRDLPDWWW